MPVGTKDFVTQEKTTARGGLDYRSLERVNEREIVPRIHPLPPRTPKPVRSVRNFARPGHDPPEHPAEDESMDRHQRVPVEAARDPPRIEQGGLADLDFPRSGRRDLELEPGAAGQFHFRPKAKEPGRLDLLDPPEVEGVARAEKVWMAASPPKPRPSDQGVQEAPEPPEPVAEVPAGVSADSLDGPERRLGRRRHPGRARVDDSRPVGLSWLPIPERVGVAPAGLRVVPVLVLQRAADRLREAARANGKDAKGTIVAYDRLVANTLDATRRSSSIA